MANIEEIADRLKQLQRSSGRPPEKPEALLASLVPYLHDGLLSHPLLVRANVNIERCADVNRLFGQKKRETRQALRERDWHSYIFLHERPYRMAALSRCLSRGLTEDKETYNQTVRDVWIDTENARQHSKLWRKVWEGSNLTETERIALAAVPDDVPISRGVRRAADGRRGFSWTLDPEVARRFATRFADSGFLIEGIVAKQDIKAYLGDRNENEVIAFPERVRIVKTTAIARRSDGFIDE